MPETDLILKLARVLIAAAWADGKIDNEEINSLKDLLFRLPHLNESEWQRLEMYIETPTDEGDRDQLLSELAGAIRTPQDRQLVLASLDAMVEADGEVTDDEQAMLAEIRKALARVDMSFFGRLAKALRPRIQKRRETAAAREAQFEDFVKNKVFYRITQRAKEQGMAFDLDPQQQRKLCLAGALMARVANVDNQVEQSERQRMEEILAKRWEIDPLEASLVTEVAIAEIKENIDNYRTTRQFFEMTTTPERMRFLASLFAIAAADGDAAFEEIEEIRDIATCLKLSHRQFIAVKVAVLG